MTYIIFQAFNYMHLIHTKFWEVMSSLDLPKD